MSDVTVNAEDFFRLSKQLKAAGQTDLRKALTKGIRQAVRPLVKDSRAAARRRLPQSGGLAALVARSPQKIQVRTGQNTYGVRIVVGKAKSAARSTDLGVIRHPVFGRGTFVSQRVPSGWFSDTAEAAQPRIVREVGDVVDDVARRAIG